MSVEYVIDTSALIQGFIEDRDSARLTTLMNMVTEFNSVTLHVPEFSLIECANVIWKQVRFHGETLDNAKRILADLRVFPLSIHPASGLLPEALEIGLAHALPLYDSVQIALADHLKLPLITTDAKQAKIASVIGVLVKPLTDFPEYVEPKPLN